MNLILEKQKISPLFYKRYFEENAKQRYGMELLKFLYFREGSFHNPMKKQVEIENYIQEEIKDFYEKGILNIPQLEFCITTKCTLNCKDCCALIPSFDSKTHLNMCYEFFKTTLDKLCSEVNSIRHLVLLGGETLLNPELSEILDYACSQEKVFVVQLITNGTMNFSSKLVNVLKKHNKKAYVYISNYSINESLNPILKHEEIINTLKLNGIKYQLIENKDWLSEKGFDSKKSSKFESQQKMLSCTRTQCNQILNGYLDICSKAATARELKMIQIKDGVNILKSKNLKQDLVSFYQKEQIEACEYCILSTEKIKPAIQK